MQGRIELPQSINHPFDLAKTLEEYRPKLALLFEVDVDAEETAGVFHPEWRQGEAD